jgi:hypothetical protein
MMPRLRKITQDEFERTPLLPDDDDTVDPSPGERSSDRPYEYYPYLSAWVIERGWIELGSDEYSGSMIRILDSGGLVWESDEWYPSLDAALAVADRALADLEAEGEI